MEDRKELIFNSRNQGKSITMANTLITLLQKGADMERIEEDGTTKYKMTLGEQRYLFVFPKIKE